MYGSLQMPTMKKHFQPDHFSSLNNNDQKKYNQLQSFFSTNFFRFNRFSRMKKFSDMLSTIHNYCIQGNQFDEIRYIVCGIIWINNSILINISQLSILTCKCKSSLNDSFQKLGYIRGYKRRNEQESPSNISSITNDTTNINKNYFNDIVKSIRFFRKNPKYLRNWSIRHNKNQVNIDIKKINDIKIENGKDDEIKDYKGSLIDFEVSFSESDFYDIDELY